MHAQGLGAEKSVAQFEGVASYLVMVVMLLCSSTWSIHMYGEDISLLEDNSSCPEDSWSGSQDEQTCKLIKLILTLTLCLSLMFSLMFSLSLSISLSLSLSLSLTLSHT